MAQALVAAPPTRHELVEASLETCMATDRGTCGSVRSATFQRCKKRAKNIEMAAMRAFSNSVSEWCGRAVAARLLHGSCPVRFLPSDRFLPGSCAVHCLVPARFLPSGRFLPGTCPTAGQDPPRSGVGRAVPAQEPGSKKPAVYHSRVLHHASPCAGASYRTWGRLYVLRPDQHVSCAMWEMWRKSQSQIFPTTQPHQPLTSHSSTHPEPK